MTFRVTERASGGGSVERVLGHGAGELRRSGLVERPKRNDGHRLVLREVSQQPLERWIVLFLLGADGGDDEAVSARGRAEELLEPLDGVRVGPLQIVDDERDRCGGPERVCQRFEKA